VRQERLDLQVILEAQAQREQQGQLDLKELLAQLDQLVVPEPQDLQERPVQPEQLDRREQRELQEAQDQQVLREVQALQAQQD
jgi:hypothetical protein